MVIHSKPKSIAVLLVAITATGCWPMKQKTQESELDAITAASKRLFGQNVRGYMWALTTDSPALFAQAPAMLGATGESGLAYDPFAEQDVVATPAAAPQAANASPVKPPVVFAGGKTVSVGKLDGLAGPLYQCWYYAETPNFTRLEGEALRSLFMDKLKTKKVNNSFINIEKLSEEIGRSEMLRQLESFALAALPGTCFLFSSVGPLKGTAKGALSNAFCSISMASLGNVRKAQSDGWGSDKARLQIQNQLKQKAGELEEVNWEVLATLREKIKDYNSTKKFADTTQVQCPLNESWVAELIGRK
ncbi:MAG: hypothetical protein EBR09_03915 [Proteobacteria bacterium]|nr:hypothetical protein [Pseudomonadota bacterium]